MLPLTIRRPPPFERRLASAVAAVLLVAGIAWVVITDAILYLLVTDTALIARIETAKGWIFVGLAALLVYCVTRWLARRLTRARAALAAVVDSIADGVLLLGPDRRIEHANPAAMEMLRCDELIGMGADEFSHRFLVSYPDGSIVPPEQFVSQRVFDEGGPLRYKAMLHPPGAPDLVISVTAAAVRDANDQHPHLVVSVMHDVTAAEHMERTRNELFAAIAHLIKTPVAVIKASVQNATTDASQTAAGLAAIERQCGRIDRLVQNLLVMARTRTETLELRQQDVDVGPVLERSVHDMAAACVQHRVLAAVGEQCRVRADAERLDLLIRDLVDAACRSAAPRSVITVALDRRHSNAEIDVEYTPIDPEDLRIGHCGAYDEIGIDRLVAAAIVSAHHWTLHEERSGPTAVLSLRLPILRTSSGA